MTFAIGDIFFGIGAILLVIKYMENKSIDTLAFAIIAVGLIFAI